MPDRLTRGCGVTSCACARTAASSAARAMASGKTITVSACVRVIILSSKMLTVYRSDRAAAGLVLAHGAGGGQQSSFMVRAAHELSARGVTIATFDFPYMAAGRSVPDKAAVLEAHWRTVVDEARASAEFAGLPLFIGGKSMGGRIASQVAAAGIDGIAGVIFFGYPLHPPGRHEKM